MNDANLILAQLNSEMAVLKKELDKCLLDLDYEYAHFFQKSMRLKATEIETIKKRIQFNYDDIQSCKTNIKMNQHAYKRMEEKLTQIQDNEKIKLSHGWTIIGLVLEEVPRYIYYHSRDLTKDFSTYLQICISCKIAYIF